MRRNPARQSAACTCVWVLKWISYTRICTEGLHFIASTVCIYKYYICRYKVHRYHVCLYFLQCFSFELYILYLFPLRTPLEVRQVIVPESSRASLETGSDIVIPVSCQDTRGVQLLGEQQSLVSGGVGTVPLSTKSRDQAPGISLVE